MRWLLPLLFLLAGCKSKPAPPVAPLAMEAYVWQSPDRPEVRAAMTRSIGTVSRLHVRAAELKWSGTRFEIQQPVTTLPTPGCGLVVRIGASASRLEWTPDQIAPVAEIFRTLAKLGPSEIQCDYDCPQKRLSRYRLLLGELQAAAGSVPVIPTALPSWLGEPDFKPLAAPRGYVLQVHSLQLPKRFGDPVLVFDPAKARAAADKAATLGFPFRIAMATYGCEVRYGADGKVSDVISEDIAAAEPTNGLRSYALADPVESANLVNWWTVERPKGLQGIIWYRLPVKGDRRNWPWLTFHLVNRGVVNNTPAVFEASPGPGARDLHVVNHGNFPVRLPSEIVVTTPVAAADGAGAYQLDQRNDGLHFLLRSDVWPWLDPDQKIPTGWLRVIDESARMESSTKP